MRLGVTLFVVDASLRKDFAGVLNGGLSFGQTVMLLVMAGIFLCIAVFSSNWKLLLGVGLV